uniref:Uncharacterized protein n=1 Tax=Cacopsylla melanoneura TaxID=428564 RepID=A0A8D8RSR9_9HEMI
MSSSTPPVYMFTISSAGVLGLIGSSAVSAAVPCMNSTRICFVLTIHAFSISFIIWFYSVRFPLLGLTRHFELCTNLYLSRFDTGLLTGFQVGFRIIDIPTQ